MMLPFFFTHHNSEKTTMAKSARSSFIFCARQVGKTQLKLHWMTEFLRSQSSLDPGNGVISLDGIMGLDKAAPASPKQLSPETLRKRALLQNKINTN